MHLHLRQRVGANGMMPCANPSLPGVAKVTVGILAATVAAAVLTGCGGKTLQPFPAKNLTPESDPPSVVETDEESTTTEPAGPNSFSPTVLAPAPPTALPGNVITGN